MSRRPCSAISLVGMFTIAAMLTIVPLRPTSSFEWQEFLRNMNITINNHGTLLTVTLPPTTAASLTLSFASLLADELRHRDVAQRLNRIDTQLNRILASLEVVEGNLVTIQRKLSFIQDRVLYVEEALSRAKFDELNGFIETAQSNWTDWVSGEPMPDAKLNTLYGFFIDMQVSRNALISQRHYDYVLSIGLATIILDDIAEILNTMSQGRIAIDADARRRMVQSGIGFFEAALMDVTPAAVTIRPSDTEVVALLEERDVIFDDSISMEALSIPDVSFFDSLPLRIRKFESILMELLGEQLDQSVTCVFGQRIIDPTPRLVGNAIVAALAVVGSNVDFTRAIGVCLGSGELSARGLHLAGEQYIVAAMTHQDGTVAMDRLFYYPRTLMRCGPYGLRGGGQPGHCNRDAEIILAEEADVLAYAKEMWYIQRMRVRSAQSRRKPHVA